MADEIVRIGLVGAGPVAALHAKAFERIDNVNIELVASRTQAAAQKFADGNSISKCMTIDSLEEMGAEAAGVDALVVVVPAVHMAGLALRLNSLGVPMLLEKPVGMSLEETSHVANSISVPNMVGLNRRFYEVIQQSKTIVDDAGGARFIEIHMPEDIRALNNRYGLDTLEAWEFGNSVHLVDLFRVFSGEVSSVHSSNETLNYWDRSYSALLNFESGARGIFNAQWYAPGPWRVCIYCDGLSITLAPIEKGIVLKSPGRKQSEISAMHEDLDLKPGFFGQAKAFRELVCSGKLADGAADIAEYARSVDLVNRLTKTI